MTTKTKTFFDEHSAVPTWSGFNYQGKVAIYLVLKLLNDPSKTADVPMYSIELEWMEDIAFLKGETYQTIHQVKAYKDSTNSKYKRAIALLVARTHVNSEISNCYLHTTLKIDPIEQETVKEYLKSKDLFKSVVPDFYGVGGGFDTAFQKFKVYSYGEDEYCGLTQIDGLILNEIRRYFDTNGRQVDNIDLVRLKLLQRIDRLVMDIHHRIQTSATPGVEYNPEPIPLTEFESILGQPHNEPSTEYWLHITKDTLSGYCDQYICELVEDDLEVTKTWWAAAQIINSFAEDEFIDFTRKVNPHVPIGSSFDADAFKNTFFHDDVRYAFFDALRLISRSIDRDQFVYIKDAKHYMPTTIKGSSGRTKERENKRIAQLILQNRGLKTLLWEIDTLVSSEMNIESIRTKASNIFDLELEGADGEMDRNRITKIGDINIIDLETAIEVLATDETDSEGSI